MLIDTHAHLDDELFQDDLPDVLRRAQEAGVEHVVTVGTSVESSRNAVAIAKKYPGISVAVGVHPNEVEADAAAGLSSILELISEETVVAIGETGLDYYRDRTPKEEQIAAFERHLGLAMEHDLPVVIHDREAHEDCLRAVRKVKGLRGVAHCFSGNAEVAEAFLELGFYISFAGPVTFPKSEGLRAVARNVPVEKLLLETDCPYLAPQARRGKRNEPAYVRNTAEVVAELHGMSLEDLARVTTLNARELFGIE